MKKSAQLLIALFAITAMASGCGVRTARTVTAHKWVKFDAGYTYFVAYGEGSGTAGRSAVKRCKFKDEDNVLACREDADLLKALNPTE